jgi:SPP1 family predicted phage head-tail adaptor
MIANKDPLVLNAGDLRHAITILKLTTSVGLAGSETIWTPFLTNVRAKLEPIKGSELIRSGQDVSQTYITVTIRYQPGILAQMRIQANNGTYIIQAIENVLERNRVLQLTCLSVGANE